MNNKPIFICKSERGLNLDLRFLNNDDKQDLTSGKFGSIDKSPAENQKVGQMKAMGPLLAESDMFKGSDETMFRVAGLRDDPSSGQFERVSVV